MIFPVTARSSLLVVAVAMASLLAAPAARAVDAATTRQYCEDIRQAAEDASVRYMQDRRPLRDPAETFDNATRSCLGSIMRFRNPVRFLSLDFSSLVSGFVDNMVSSFLNRACTAVRGEFDRSVVDAERFLRERSRARQSAPALSGKAAPAAVPPSGLIVNRPPGG